MAPLFSVLSRTERLAVAERTRVVQLRSHDMLWREGDKAVHLGLVLHGRVALERTPSRRLIIDVVGAEQLVGHIALLLGGTHQFDVRCLRKARVALVPVAELRSLASESPEIAFALASVAAQEVMRLTRRLEALSAGSVRQRLARVLLGLTERFGTPFPGGTLMPVRLRREDLAALAATTLESASRQVSVWHRQGGVGASARGLSGERPARAPPAG